MSGVTDAQEPALRAAPDFSVFLEGYSTAEPLEQAGRSFHLAPDDRINHWVCALSRRYAYALNHCGLLHLTDRSALANWAPTALMALALFWLPCINIAVFGWTLEGVTNLIVCGVELPIMFVAFWTLNRAGRDLPPALRTMLAPHEVRRFFQQCSAVLAVNLVFCAIQATVWSTAGVDWALWAGGMLYLVLNVANSVATTSVFLLMAVLDRRCLQELTARVARGEATPQKALADFRVAEARMQRTCSVQQWLILSWFVTASFVLLSVTYQTVLGNASLVSTLPTVYQVWYAGLTMTAAASVTEAVDRFREQARREMPREGDADAAEAWATVLLYVETGDTGYDLLGVRLDYELCLQALYAALSLAAVLWQSATEG